MKNFIKYTALVSFLFVIFLSVNVYGEETEITLSNAKITDNTITIEGSVKNPTDNQQLTFIAAELLSDSEDIFYINQLPFKENTTDNQSFVLSFDITSLLNNESIYIVRVGGTNIYNTAQMIISVGDEIVVILGDVDMDGVITASDAALTLQYVLHNNGTYLQKQVDAMMVTKSQIVTSNNAANILAKALDDAYIFPVER